MNNYPTLDSILDSFQNQRDAVKDVSMFKYSKPYGSWNRDEPKVSARDKARKARKAIQEAKNKIKEALEKGHKTCSSCNQELSLSSFDVDKKTFTGYSSWCKDCKKEYNKRYLKGNIDNDKTYRKQEGETT